MLATIIFGMINAESVVTSDICRKLKGEFHNVSLESTERRCSVIYNFILTIIIFSINNLVLLFMSFILMLNINIFLIQRTSDNINYKIKK